MAKTFSVNANKFPLKEGSEADLATSIKNWLDGLSIADGATVYSIETEIRQGFVLVIAIASG